MGSGAVSTFPPGCCSNNTHTKRKEEGECGQMCKEMTVNKIAAAQCTS